MKKPLFNLIQGDCLTELKRLEADSIHALVTDPPAGIGFMGKEWDTDKGGRKEWIYWMTSVMEECLRVMKPGAHGLIWAIPRTSHWTATALEDAGFEVRDVVTHLFGSGFPKSLDVSKAIDKAAGAEREVIGQNPNHRNAEPVPTMLGNPHTGSGAITVPATDAAKQWQGFGTALKPASEHWILVRKPCSEKTVAANVLKHGTGALNIDASRIEAGPDLKPALSGAKGSKQADFGAGTQFGNSDKYVSHVSPAGRFPANLVLSHSPQCEENQCALDCAVKGLDEQSGPCPGPWGKDGNGKAKGEGSLFKQGGVNSQKATGASRFFYCAKISTRERNAGCNGLPDKKVGFSDGARAIERGEGSYETETGGGANRIKTTKNSHPTVKPKRLMDYLIRMITPPGGTVLDPFMGSGSTGIAAVEGGFRFIGIEREAEYTQIAEKRIYHTLPEFRKQVSST